MNTTFVFFSSVSRLAIFFATLFAFNSLKFGYELLLIILSMGILG